MSDTSITTIIDYDKARFAVTRGWGNAYIAVHNNHVPVFVLMDWDRIAHYFNFTEEDKLKAIDIMAGDVYDYMDAEIAKQNFVNRDSSQNNTKS